LRIISGIYKGRILQVPAKLPVRPTTDFAREALFNILHHQFDFDEISFLDLFSGTGAISLEMASRGCSDITSVDENRNCVQFTKQTAEAWKIKGLKTYKDDVFKFIQHCQFRYHLIFADPPYAHPQLAQLPDLILKKNMLLDEGWLIIEHPDQISFTAHSCFLEHRRYGNVNFSIFKASNN
jgi:16S rRNA (guanine966-N2)-methyltransferase